jgi:hypothetical protein
MKDPKKLFHKISYLQYPLMLLGLFYCCKPTLFGIDSIWIDLNKGLVFFGLAISLSTLQDITKTQEKISKRVFENPKYARIFLWLVVVQIIFFNSIGMYGLYFSSSQALKDLAYGLISIGIGVVGILKSAIEMAEHHQSMFVTQPSPD